MKDPAGYRYICVYVFSAGVAGRYTQHTCSTSIISYDTLSPATCGIILAEPPRLNGNHSAERKCNPYDTSTYYTLLLVVFVAVVLHATLPSSPPLTATG